MEGTFRRRLDNLVLRLCCIKSSFDSSSRTGGQEQGKRQISPQFSAYLASLALAVSLSDHWAALGMM